MNFSTVNGDVNDYVVDRVFNVAIRELFLNKFVHVFFSYEKFVIPPSQVRTLAESMHRLFLFVNSVECTVSV